MYKAKNTVEKLIKKHEKLMEVEEVKNEISFV